MLAQLSQNANYVLGHDCNQCQAYLPHAWLGGSHSSIALATIRGSNTSGFAGFAHVQAHTLCLDGAGCSPCQDRTWLGGQAGVEQHLSAISLHRRSRSLDCDERPHAERCGPAHAYVCAQTCGCSDVGGLRAERTMCDWITKWEY